MKTPPDPQRVLRPSAVDGQVYTEAQEREIDDVLLTAFRAPAGAKALAYLRSITVFRALGPDAPDCALRHLEGMRFLVAVIEARMKAGELRRSAATHAS